MKPRILIAHTKYQQRGGEDQVVEAEFDLLKKNGHEVQLYLEDNSRIQNMSRFILAANTLWSNNSAQKITELINEFEPDIIHVHNTFPLMSPSIYWTAAKRGVPVVQTLHNYRLLCPQAMLLRDGHVCEDCIGRVAWRGVQHKCYHNSAAQSAIIAAMLFIHRSIGTYQTKVSAYISLTSASREKYISGGLPADSIHIKPNFVDIDYIKSSKRNNGLFVGRLSQEKGLECLALAANMLNNSKINVIGSGPMEDYISKSPSLVLLGWKDPKEVYEHMRKAAYLIVPSIWHETFGLIVIEAFANGLPVIASRIGALADLVKDNHTGLLFEPGSSSSLAEKISWANDNPELMADMGHNARLEYEKKFSPDSNYTILKDIYNQVLL